MVKKENHPDFILLIIALILILLGILILTSASAPLSQKISGSIFYFLKHQLLFGLLPGVIFGFLAFRINLNLLKKWAFPLLLINLLLLAMVFIPKIGLRVRGATRWISWGDFTFQPSEFLKFTFILYLSAWISGRASKKREFNQTFLAFLIILTILSLCLIFQPDISTLGIIMVVGFLIYFLSQTPLWQNILVGLIGILALILLIYLAPYRLARLNVFLNPEADPMAKGYQLKQALIGIGAGGLLGSGLGTSGQKFGFLPGAISDAIFAIFAEETGFLGGLILILLFFGFFWRIFNLAKKTSDQFSQLLALGIGLWILFQTFVNISSVIGILPLSGIPLPFVSYGGSHLVAEIIGIGLVLNISKESK